MRLSKKLFNHSICRIDPAFAGETSYEQNLTIFRSVQHDKKENLFRQPHRIINRSLTITQKYLSFARRNSSRLVLAIQKSSLIAVVFQAAFFLLS